MSEERMILCGANAYEKKYYFNEMFSRIPGSIQDELHIICVLFTEEAGGVFTVADENDVYYDEIGSGLLVKEIRRKRKELLQSLSLYYRALVLKEDLTGMLEEEG